MLWAKTAQIVRAILFGQRNGYYVRWPSLLHLRGAIIAYTLETEIVSIMGVFYGGRDYEAALAPDDE